MERQEKVVLITGASGGLGYAITKFLVDQGWQVIATDIEVPPTSADEHISWMRMDVTDEEEINQVYEVLAKENYILDAIINTAGILDVGSVIEVEPVKAHEVLDTNLMGTYRVNYSFLPLLRPQSGRIINFSSEVGWQTTAPFNGVYSMSKYGLEAYSDALRRELMFLGIYVIKIQPGAFMTRMTGSIVQRFEQVLRKTTHFSRPIRRGIKLATDVHEKANNPEKITRVVHRALKAARPRSRYSVSPDPLRSILTFLPTRVQDWAIRKALS